MLDAFNKGVNTALLILCRKFCILFNFILFALLSSYDVPIILRYIFFLHVNSLFIYSKITLDVKKMFRISFFNVYIRIYILFKNSTRYVNSLHAICKRILYGINNNYVSRHRCISRKRGREREATFSRIKLLRHL